MADVKIIDVSSLKEKYPELAMKVEILSKYAGIEMPVRAKENRHLKTVSCSITSTGWSSTNRRDSYDK